MKRIILMSLTCAALASQGPLTAASPAQNSGSAASPVQYFHKPGSKMPFSPAVRVGNILYLSGQIGTAPDGTQPADFAAQAKAAMDNVAASLALAGATLDAVFKCTVMMDDMSKWQDFNKVYVSYFKPDRLPARSAFGARGLAFGASVEVECMAYAPVAGER
jgi:2-iminobutanoate/2-iminopropanoate deaminase